MSYILDGNRIVMGTDYYPEHWDSSMWEDDLHRMLDTGIEVIRIAEFAWNKFEPKEGEFSFEFFDSFLDLCNKTGMKAIFGTPTATPPAWMTDKYPEVLNARIDGVLYRHGGRRHYNYNSRIYQDFTKELVEKLASHYGPNPAVIGWQIDNEINCEKNEFYSESDTLAFRKFLKEKYKTIEKLNEAWGTVFWNQTYSSWGEVYVPRLTLSGNTNPHEMLDYKRFVSDSACKWAKMQSDIIRKYLKPGDFITTNGIFQDLDSHRMTEESLDFITYDSYPNMAYELDGGMPQNGLKDRYWSKMLDEVRSIHGIYGIMEQQSGANGWNVRMISPSPRPGQITLWTMQSIAHRADYIGYFRWRTSTIGTEIYWHGILDYSGRDNRRLKEVKNIHQLFSKIQGVAGKEYEAKVGILEYYDNKWDAELDIWHGRIEELSSNAIYLAAQHTHTPIDYVYLRGETRLEDLLKYKVLFYPHAVIADERQVELLASYVEQGGILVLGCRAGLKKTTGQCTQEDLPGVFSRLAGTNVSEFTFVAKDEGMIYADWDGTKIETTLFNEELVPLNNAKILACYDNSYYKGSPALIENSVGKGKVYYLGSCFTENTARIFLEKLEVSNPYGKVAEAPECCEIAVRTDGKDRYLFILNYEKAKQTVSLHQPMTDLYSSKEVSGNIDLEPYGTIVLKY